VIKGLLQLGGEIIPHGRMMTSEIKGMNERKTMGEVVRKGISQMKRNGYVKLGLKLPGIEPVPRSGR
jgi:hypothetical protein